MTASAAHPHSKPANSARLAAMARPRRGGEARDGGGEGVGEEVSPVYRQTMPSPPLNPANTGTPIGPDEKVDRLASAP